MAGRPPLEVAKTEKVEVRVTAEEKLNWKIAPEYTALTMSEFWRVVVDMLGPTIVSFYDGDITEEEFKGIVGGDLLNWVDEKRGNYHDDEYYLKPAKR